MSSGGFSFGGTTSAATTAPISGFSFGANLTQQTSTTTATTPSGLSFGSIGTSTTNALGTTSLGGFGANANATGGGLLGGLNKTTTAATGTTTTGLTFGGLSGGTAATSAPTGFALGIGQPTSGLTLGAPKSTVAGFAGLGSTITTTATSGGTGIFANAGLSGLTSTTAASTASTHGLGGVDLKTTNTGTSNASGNVKSSDSKAVKEYPVPNEICTTVEDFKKYVKEQKTVRENIARLSSKPMFKVQEEVASLKQLLSLVSNGLHRNAVSIDKLKKESAQELKHAEMAHRTKDTPAGLQYENTMPTEYFHVLLEDFEKRMVMYRQQIEDTENHLASFSSASALSPQELAKLLNKLHESFVALAAQLQAVHEYVQSQKEQYLNYRKVFHGDNTDIFERRKRAQDKTGSGVVVTAGPTPFTEMSSAAATAMASALNRTQQPQVQQQLMPQSNLLGANVGTGIGFGTQQPAGSGLFGGSGTGTGQVGGGLFGQTTQQQSGGLFNKPLGNVQPFGSGFNSAPATTAQNTGFAFSTNTATVRPLG